MKSFSVFAALVLLGSGSKLYPQGAIRSADSMRSLCPKCSIVSRPVVTLGDREGPGVLEGSPAYLARDDNGRYFLTQINSRDGRAVVFDSTGANAFRLGSRGTTLGDFKFVRRVLPLGDNLLVVDPGTLRVSVLDQSARLQSSLLLPDIALGYDIIALHNGHGIVVNASIPTRALAGLPLHLYRSDFNYVRSFTQHGSPSFRVDQSKLLRRKLASSINGTSFWTARQYEYKAQLLDLNGRVLRALAPTRSWFPADSNGDLKTARGEAPSPEIVGLREVKEGFLWVFMLVPDSNWRRAMRSRKIVRGRDTATVNEWPDLDTRFDTVIELFDIRTLALVASTRLPQAVTMIVDDDQVASTRYHSNGVAYVQVWRVELHRPKS